MNSPTSRWETPSMHTPTPSGLDRIRIRSALNRSEATQHMTSVIEFEPNTSGREFVCGDIHGCFDTVEHALEELHYHPLRDRLFALGDLIDYGQRSEDALEWIESRFTATVRGNHQQSMLDWLLAHGRVRMHICTVSRASTKSCRSPTSEPEPRFTESAYGNIF